MANSRISGTTTVGPRRCAVVTPDDSSDITVDGAKVAGHIRADASGNLRVLPEGNDLGDWVTFTMAAGEVTQIPVRRVAATGTDISVLHVLY